MCETIRLKNRNKIETIIQFENYFKINADKLKYDSSDKIDKKCCLCPIDLDKFLKDKPFTKAYGDWWED